MTLLQVMPEGEPRTLSLRTRDPEVILGELAGIGVGYAHWPIDRVDPDASNDAILAAYRTEIDDLRKQDGYRLVDVARMRPTDTPDWADQAAAARAKFLDEHQHSEDEVRFFVCGSGCFYLHVKSRVYAVVCEASDLLSVPAATRHWFDMGPTPDFVAVRFFTEEDGWIGDFTGNPIASSFPRLDELTVRTS
jgi:1,2-dihydroxy-3-keto-5-methylthiopentene dioxygenase